MELHMKDNGCRARLMEQPFLIKKCFNLKLLYNEPFQENIFILDEQQRKKWK